MRQTHRNAHALPGREFNVSSAASGGRGPGATATFLYAHCRVYEIIEVGLRSGPGALTYETQARLAQRGASDVAALRGVVESLLANPYGTPLTGIDLVGLFPAADR